MYNFIRPTEVILMEGKANKTAFLGVNSGGTLILTNERLIFKHGLSSKLDEINLNDILFEGNDINILIPSKNMIKVITRTGAKYQFLVVGRQKEQWHMALQKITKSC